MAFRPSGNKTFFQVSIFPNVPISSSIAAFQNSASGPESASSGVLGKSGSVLVNANSFSSSNASNSFSVARLARSLGLDFDFEAAVGQVTSGAGDGVGVYRRGVGLVGALRAPGIRACGFPESL